MIWHLQTEISKGQIEILASGLNNHIKNITDEKIYSSLDMMSQLVKIILKYTQ